MAVCHNHTPSILPFSIATRARLQAVIHSASFLGLAVPVWDIAEEFGTETNLLVQSMEQGHSLARALRDQPVALMRGHGSVVVGGNLETAVSNAINMEKNARVQLQALQLDEIIPLHPGEVAFRRVGERPDHRAWEYWKRRAGC
jgi:HCOMODA/2-hydroxy-3-carboxy-muconic semialdehyde decarboxylase